MEVQNIQLCHADLRSASQGRQSEAVAAGTVVESFKVIWPTNTKLVDATYEAFVVLTATSL